MISRSRITSFVKTSLFPHMAVQSSYGWLKNYQRFIPNNTKQDINAEKTLTAAKYAEKIHKSRRVKSQGWKIQPLKLLPWKDLQKIPHNLRLSNEGITSGKPTAEDSMITTDDILTHVCKRRTKLCTLHKYVCWELWLSAADTESFQSYCFRNVTALFPVNASAITTLFSGTASTCLQSYQLGRTIFFDNLFYSWIKIETICSSSNIAVVQLNST